MALGAWHMVAIATTVLTIVVGTTVNAFGLFVLPVSEAFSLSRANVTTGMILLNFGSAACSPIIGRMLDDAPIRRVMVIGSILLGGSLVCLGLSSSIWLSTVILVLPLAIGASSAGVLTATTLVAQWFDTDRGRAMAVTAVGMSLGSVLIVPLVGLLIERLGWRMALIVEGASATLILLLLACFVRSSRHGLPSTDRGRGANAMPPDDIDHGARPIRTGELLRTCSFWTIAASVGLTFGVLQTVSLSLAPLAQQNGLTVFEAAGLLSIMGGASIAGKVLLAFLGDRMDRIYLLCALFVLVGLASLALQMGRDHASLAACAVALGFSAGAITPVFMALLADRFGAASFGTANGTATLVMAIVAAGCIRTGGEMFDRTGRYDLMLLSFCFVCFASALLIVTSRVSSRPLNQAGESARRRLRTGRDDRSN